MTEESKNVFETDCMCSSCKGTGIYVGMAEKGGIGIQCANCDGTGISHIKISWKNPPEAPVVRDDVAWVLETNVGVFITIDEEFPPGSFGGMSYQDWCDGRTFVLGMEMRTYVCPRIWYQSADYKRKPNWDECHCGFFKDCPSFEHVEECWARIDREAEHACQK